MEKLAEGWVESKLENLASFINGYAFKQENWKEEGLPIIRIEQLLNPHAKCDYSDITLPDAYLINDGDLIFSWSATIAIKLWNRGKSYLNQHLYKVIPKSIIDKKYLKHLLNHKIKDLLKETHGTTMKHITRSFLLNFKVFYPKDYNEQRKIAEILETADKTIEKTDVIIEKYRRIKQGLMQDLLTKGIDENGQIRNEDTHKFKDSPLGRMPEEWEVTNIGKAGKVITGSTPPTANPKYYGDCYLFISPGDITNSKFITDSQKKLSECGFKISRSVLPYSICVVCIGSIGKVAMTKSICTTNQQINSIIPDINIFNPDALFYFVLFYSQTPLKHEAGLQVVPIVNKSRFSTIKIPLPPLPEQHRIASILSQIDEVIEKEERYKEKLERIKQGLMQDLLTGKVRVNHLIEEF